MTCDDEELQMKISLVLATLGRSEEIRQLFDSIVQQDYSDIEVVVVDQNTDDRLIPILQAYEASFPIVHLHSSPGLSRARNVGMAAATGSVIGFPDDDSWYPAGMLGRLASLFDENPDIAGYTGLCVDEHGNISVGGSGLTEMSGGVTRNNVWRCGVSASIFIRTSAAKVIGNFDEKLGLGSGTPFQSGEETDFLLRAIGLDYKVMFRRDLLIHHPMPPTRADRAVLRRTWGYGLGMGRVMRKHRYSALCAVSAVGRPIIGAAVSFGSGRLDTARLRFVRAAGRLQGLLASEQGQPPIPPSWLRLS
jgi:glycosyltransferase involved in cell wall biosynthesis